MTIKEYILSKPDDYKFEIDYLFSCFCPICRKEVIEFDDEYSSGISTAAEFKEEVAGNCKISHYRGYSFVYNDFYIDSCKLTKGDEGQEVITIIVDGEEEVCSECEEKQWNEDEEQE